MLSVMLTGDVFSAAGSPRPACDALTSGPLPTFRPGVDQEAQAVPGFEQSDQSSGCAWEQLQISSLNNEDADQTGAPSSLGLPDPAEPVPLQQDSFIAPHLIEDFQHFQSQHPQEDQGLPRQQTSPRSYASSIASSPGASPRVPRGAGRGENRERWAIEIPKDSQKDMKPLRQLLDHVLEEEVIKSGQASLYLIYVMCEVPWELGVPCKISKVDPRRAKEHEKKIFDEVLDKVEGAIKRRHSLARVKGIVERKDHVDVGLCEAAKRLKVSRLVIIARKTNVRSKGGKGDPFSELGELGCSVVALEGKRQSAGGSKPSVPKQGSANAGPTAAGNQASSGKSGLWRGMLSGKSKSLTSSSTSSVAAPLPAGVVQAQSSSPPKQQTQPPKQSQTKPQGTLQQLLRMPQQQPRQPHLAENAAQPSGSVQPAAPQSEAEQRMGGSAVVLQGSERLATVAEPPVTQQESMHAGSTAPGSQADLAQRMSCGSSQSVSQPSSRSNSVPSGRGKVEEDQQPGLHQEKLEDYLQRINTYLARALSRHKAYMSEDGAVICTQVLEVLRAFPTLGLTREIPEGVRKWAPQELEGQSQLVGISGTIPLMFRGARYQIPVALVLSPLFPHFAPLCWVLPEEGMEITQNHSFVDQRGQCHLASLHWTDGQHTLMDAATEMQRIFSVEPPLFATQVARHASATTATPVAPALQRQPSSLSRSSLERQNSLNEATAGVLQRRNTAANERGTASGRATSQGDEALPYMHALEPGEALLGMGFARLRYLYLRHKQEDEAQDDSMRTLTKNLEDGGVSIEGFLKETRKLAWEQFFQKVAVIQLGTAIKLAVEQRPPVPGHEDSVRQSEDSVGSSSVGAASVFLGPWEQNRAQVGVLEYCSSHSAA